MVTEPAAMWHLESAYKALIMSFPDQVGRSWAHLLPRIHQTYKCSPLPTDTPDLQMHGEQLALSFVSLFKQTVICFLLMSQALIRENKITISLPPLDWIIPISFSRKLNLQMASLTEWRKSDILVILGIIMIDCLQGKKQKLMTNYMGKWQIALCVWNRPWRQTVLCVSLSKSMILS